MTTDVSSTANARCLQLQQHHSHDHVDRVKSAPQPESATSLAAASALAHRRASMRSSINMMSMGRNKSSTKTTRQSIKFSPKDFVTKWCDNLEKDYEMGDLLGEGAYGNVYACTHKETGAERAVKIIPKSPDEKQNQMVIQEFKVLRELDHPNVLKNYALYETDTDFHIVTDWIRGGELYDLLESEFTEDEVRSLLKALLSCMNYCHQMGVVHRDLKPENILLEESHDFGQIKVIDFGLAEFFAADKDNGGSFTEAAGSSYYMSPQVIEGQYSAKCDIWSCGVIAYVCLGGYAPFAGEDEMDTAQQILDATDGVYFDDPVWDEFSDDALDFIEYLMTYKEDERPTAAMALQHKWLQQSDKRLSLEQQSSMQHSARLSLESLKSFQAADSKLKQCTYSLIASQIVKKEQVQDIDAIFSMLDVDCDGKISSNDMKTIYNDKFGVQLDEDDLSSIIYEVNLSGSGAITYSEFVIASMLEKGILVTDHNLELAFTMMDKTQSGYLTFESLKDVLPDVKDDMEDYVNRRIITPADLDGDGKISLQDFKGFFNGERPQSQSQQRRRSSMAARSRRPSSVASSTSSSCSRRSTRKSFRTSALLSSLQEPDDPEMAALRAEFNNSLMLNSSCGVLSTSISEEPEPTFKNLLNIFETQIKDNSAHGSSAVPSMFRNSSSSGE